MTIILTWGAGISCNYSFNMLKMWTFLILEFLSKYSPGIAKSEHRGKGPMDLLSGRSLGCKSLFKPWSICPPANTHPLLRKRKKGIWKGTEFTKFTQKGIVTTSDSEATEVCICLLSGEIQLDVSRQPSVFHRSCPGSHCSTLTLTELGWQRALHPKNLSNHFHPPGGSGWKAPVWSIKAFFPPPEKEDETQRLSSASWPLSSRAVEGSRRQQQLWRYGPRHKPPGQAFKTFSSRHHPSNSRLLVGECLFLQLLPHLLPQPFGFYSI